MRVEPSWACVAGHRLAYWSAGPVDAPVVVLVHGLLSTSATWAETIGPLAERGLRVLAVDLVGHGESDKPPGAYLLDDFAASLAGFLDVLDVEAATVCGHSFGGAIAVHFAYHYPKRVQRLVLVSSGGLGKEVTLALRALAVPGAERFTAAVLDRRLVRRALRHPAAHRALRLPPARMDNLRRVVRTLVRPDMRAAFFASLRGVIGPSGQRGSFLEMEYLAAHVPTLLVWSSEDVVIPVAHAHHTHARLPASRLVIFSGGGHEPHRRYAPAFADEVGAFVLNPAK